MGSRLGVTIFGRKTAIFLKSYVGMYALIVVHELLYFESKITIVAENIYKIKTLTHAHFLMDS
jgi:hypothetical protein